MSGISHLTTKADLPECRRNRLKGYKIAEQIGVYRSEKLPFRKPERKIWR
jgi:hypothetical protein